MGNTRPADLNDAIAFQLHRAVQVFIERAERISKEWFPELNLRRTWIILAVSRATLCQNELAEVLYISKYTVLDEIDAMEKLGLVRRRANPDDARQKHILLTPKGKAVAHRAMRDRALYYRKLLGPLKPKQVKAIWKMIEDLGKL